MTIRRSRSGAIAFALALLATVGLAAAEFARSRQTAATPFGEYGIFRMARPAPPGAELVADGGPVRFPRVWLVSTAGGTLTATPWALAGGRARPGLPVALGAPPRGLLGVRIDAWRGRPAAFVIASSGRGVGVSVRTLDGTARQLAEGLAPAPLPRGDRRYVAVARWGGVEPALVLVDRHARDPARMAVRVFGGSGGFGQLAADLDLDQANLGAAGWLPVPANVESLLTDLVFVSRGIATSSRHLEVHVLVGATGFQTFGEQRALLAPVPPAAAQEVIGFVGGTPVLYVALPGGPPTIEALSL